MIKALIRNAYIFFVNFDPSRYRYRNLDKSKLRWPFRMMRHPLSALYEIKYEGRGSLALANACLFLFFLLQVIRYSGRGFLFNTNLPEDFSLPFQLAVSCLPICLWCISLWASSVLFDGEGSFRELYITSAYALLPLMLFSVLEMLLSNVLLLEEAAFLALFTAIGTGWTILLYILSTLVIEQFTLKRTVFCMLTSLFFLLLIVFIGLLLMNFLQQMVLFVQSVVKEIVFR